MKASLAAQELVSPVGEPRFVTFDEMRGIAVFRDLTPTDGSAVVIDGAAFRDFFPLEDLEAVEARINALRTDVVLASNQAKSPALSKAVQIAQDSEHGHELNYLLGMFIHHKEVLRELAKNRSLPVDAQRRLVSDPELVKDKQLQRVLARNPALSAEAMRTMLAATDDSLVQVYLAENAAEQSSHLGTDNEYTRIAESLVENSFTRLVRIAALPGVRSEDLLRKIADTHDTLLGAPELAAVASNRHTPADVLQRLEQPSGIGSVLQRALQTTAAAVIGKLAQKTLRDRRDAEAASLYHSTPD